MLIVAVAGPIGLANVDELGAALNHPCDSDVRHIIVDLAEATFVDSSGVHELAMAAEDLEAHRATLTLVQPVRAATGLFGIGASGLDVEIADSLETALRRFPAEARVDLLPPDAA